MSITRAIEAVFSSNRKPPEYNKWKYEPIFKSETRPVDVIEIKEIESLVNALKNSEKDHVNTGRTQMAKGIKKARLKLNKIIRSYK